MAILTVGVLLYRIYLVRQGQEGDEKSFDRYYVMITDDLKSSFWQSVYSGAQSTALDKNVFVELLGSNLSYDYTPEELMEIAISSHVDGIMVYGGETERMKELIDEASQKGIPVVTMYSDNPNSQRCSFVGVSGYNMGREYGRQVTDVLREKKRLSYNGATSNGEEEPPIGITMLVDKNMSSSDQNVIMSGLKDSLSGEENGTGYDIRTMAVDNSNPFSVEESIRDVFMEENIPDILICLNELDTTCAYQAAIDYNMVGSVYILGYYDSDKILNAISRNVVFSSVAIDTNELGSFCVEALEEYNESGNTSQYFTADITLIDRNNVSQFMTKEEPADVE
ncbi:MAG: substrate-binding domain-containing protein [Lachnospiraceae bacterium]|nr:substrate-binding domain-containing protein [Lachnospiraceae bacterium]